ncbi:MAG TPA: ATP-binding cassette domain-containing protein, partial [bacterium]|nr:ATP-binding cassette domain-containing protein [bacterium]
MMGAGTSPDYLLEVRGLRKYFPIHKGFLRKLVGQVRAVDDVSFSIERGQTLALVGESGCGKTTTARCIIRAHAPTAGQI